MSGSLPKFRVDDVVLFKGHNLANCYVGIVASLDQDGDPEVLWRHVVTGRWTGPRVIVSDLMTNLGPLPKGVEWDV